MGKCVLNRSFGGTVKPRRASTCVMLIFIDPCRERAVSAVEHLDLSLRAHACTLLFSALLCCAGSWAQYGDIIQSRRRSAVAIPTTTSAYTDAWRVTSTAVRPGCSSGCPQSHLPLLTTRHRPKYTHSLAHSACGACCQLVPPPPPPRVALSPPRPSDSVAVAAAVAHPPSRHLRLHAGQVPPAPPPPMGVDFR